MKLIVFFSTYKADLSVVVSFQPQLRLECFSRLCVCSDAQDHVSIVCFVYDCMDACVVLYDFVQSARYTWWSRRRRRTLKIKAYRRIGVLRQVQHGIFLVVLYTFNHLIHIACVYLDCHWGFPSILYLYLDTFGICIGQLCQCSTTTMIL